MDFVESKIKWIQKNIPKSEELLVRTNQDEDDENIWFVHYADIVSTEESLSLNTFYMEYGNDLDVMLDRVIEMVKAKK